MAGACHLVGDPLRSVDGEEVGSWAGDHADRRVLLMAGGLSPSGLGWHGQGVLLLPEG